MPGSRGRRNRNDGHQNKLKKTQSPYVTDILVGQAGLEPATGRL